MWFPAVTAEAPTDAVIGLDSAKEFLRVDGDAEDGTVTDAIASAVGLVEAHTSTRLLTQTVELRASRFSDLAWLPIGPVTDIVKIAYLDQAGGSQLLDPGMAELFGAGLERGIRPAFAQSWPATRVVDDAVTVQLEVGYGAAQDIPAPVMRAVLLLLGDFYSLRGDTMAERGVTPVSVPNGVATNLVNFRV